MKPARFPRRKKQYAPKRKQFKGKTRLVSMQVEPFGGKGKAMVFKSSSGKQLMVFKNSFPFLERLFGRRALNDLLSQKSPWIVDEIEAKIRSMQKWLLHPDSPYTTFEASPWPGRTIIVKDFSRVSGEKPDAGFREVRILSKAFADYNFAIKKGIIKPSSYRLSIQRFLLATPQLAIAEAVFRPTLMDVKNTAIQGYVPDYLHDFSGSDFHFRAVQKFFKDFEKFFPGSNPWEKKKALWASLSRAFSEFEAQNRALKQNLYGNSESLEGFRIAEPNIIVEGYNPKTGVWDFRIIDRE
ncbi:MAG: hypothetical protein QXK06_05800 [Candidatus Diapherotrites archaeon]